MESIIPLAVLLGILAILYLGTRRIGNTTGESLAPSSETTGDSQAPSSEQAEKQTKRFDERCAKPVETKIVIEGPASIIDGDTVVIRKTQIRLFGVDAPEIDHPYGKKAKWALIALCKGKSVRAVVGEIDVHGRTVAQCFLPDGRDLSAEMVKLGLALDWPKFSGGRYRALETWDARKKLWLADARQKGRMHVWAKFAAKQNSKAGRQ